MEIRTKAPKAKSPHTLLTHPFLWLGLSLGFAALYGALAMREGFKSEYIIQDDARIYLIWMQRFLDPELFPKDLIADYFKSITPWGLGTLYHLVALIGITPVLFSKLLPFALSLILGWYGYQLTMQLFPVSIAGFFSSLILLQSCWQRDDLASASPRSFWEILLTAFLLYLVRRNWLFLAGTVVAMTILCPLAAVLMIIFLGLRWAWTMIQMRQSPFKLADLFPRALRPELVILGVAIVGLLPYVFSQSEFAPTVTAAQARLMPEFLGGGRLPFFYSNPFRFWIEGTDSGLQVSFNPPVIGLGLLLPGLVRLREKIPLLQRLQKEWTLLLQLALAGLVGFFLAHALFVKIHFPSRYVTHSWRIAMAIAAGIVLTIALNSLLVRARQIQATLPKLLAQAGVGLLAVVIAVYPHFGLKDFPETGYVTGTNPALYEFLKTTPKSSLNAYLGLDAENLPLMAQRPILTGLEYAIPFHLGYYNQIRQRTLDLIHAQYSPDLKPAKQLIQKYQVSYWLVDQAAFTPNYLKDFRWMRLFEPETSQAIANLTTGKKGAIAQIIPQCSIKVTGAVTVLDAQCILRSN